MSEGYSEPGLDFSGMLDDEILEIADSSPGRYGQDVIDGAKNELEGRVNDAESRPQGGEDDSSRSEIGRQVVAGEAPPPIPIVEAPAAKLFSVRQITLASFLSTPAVGGLLMAHNHRALNKAGRAWRHIAVGAVATILLVIIHSVLLKKSPGTGLSLGMLIGTYYYAKHLQGEAIANHFRAGGRQVSWWAAVAASVGCTVAVLVLAFVLVARFDIGMTVAKVRVSQAGQIELDGVKVTPEQFRTALVRLQDEDAEVWYYREGLSVREPPSEAAAKAFKAIVDARLPVRISSKPDFSDYLDKNGRSIPSQ